MPRGKNREQILEAGLALMYDRGFHSSGIQEIADASGVPKGSFYNYFKSKEDFAIQALDLYVADLSCYLQEKLIDAGGSPLGRLGKLFDTWTRHQFSKNNGCGCFAGNLSQEIANHSPAIRSALDKGFARLETYYRRCLEEAKEAGELPEDSDPKLLASFVYNSWQGALVRAKAWGNPKPLKQFKTIVFHSLLAT